MTANELQTIIKNIIYEGPKPGIELYALIKQDGFKLQKVRATDKLQNAVAIMCEEELKSKYLSDDFELEDAINSADQRKISYEIKMGEAYSPFELEVDRDMSFYSEEDKARLVGFFFRMNKNDDFIWGYQHIYPMKKIVKSKNIMVLWAKDTYDVLEKDIIKMDNRIDLLVVGKSIITANISLLQSQFGFEQYIREQASVAIKAIERMDIVDDIEKIVELSNKTKLTFAKKLMKAQNSPVLQMDRKALVSKLKRHSRYKDMLLFEKGKIVISSQEAAKNFLKMLNDDIVKSEITGQEYDSQSKSLLEPV